MQKLQVIKISKIQKNLKVLKSANFNCYLPTKVINKKFLKNNIKL